MDLAERVAALRALRVQENELWELDPDEPPRPPAAGDQIDALVTEHGLPPDYRAFLCACDGWEDIALGWVLHGCADLAAAIEHAADVFGDTDTPDEEAARALVVGTSQNDAGLLYFDRASRRPDGSMDLVDWLYEERERYASFAAFLDALIEGTRDGNAHQRAARETTRAQWTDEWRRADDAELRAALAKRLATAELPPPLTAARIAALPARPALDPAALHDAATGAALRIVVTIAMRAAPSPDEIYALLAAFRRHFPTPTAAHVKRLSSWGTTPFERWSADDPALRAAIGEPGPSGAFGLTVVLGDDAGMSRAPAGPSLTIHAPGECEPAIAAYLLAMLPVATEPAAVRGFTLDAADVLPFVSGHVAYGGVASGSDAVEVVQRWARQCIALDVQDLRLELRALRQAVKGASWLTLLGTPVVAALRARFGADVVPAGSERRHGIVIEAGDLGLGFSAAIANIDRVVSPLRITLGNDELLSLGGNLWTAHYSSYDGSLGEGDGSYEWLERWIRPEVWLGPTPRERALALFAAVPGATPPTTTTRYDELLRLLFNASTDHAATDTGIAALAFIAGQHGHMQANAVSSLLFGFLQRGELDRGAALVDLAVQLAPEKPFVLHNAACIVARRGEIGRAIELVRAAKEHGYEQWQTLHADDDLASLRGHAEFEALFAAPS